MRFLFLSTFLLVSSICAAQSPGFNWALGIGGNANDFCNDIAIDQNGDVYVTGYFRDTIDFDPGLGDNILASNGNRDCFIAKYSPAGGLVWAGKVGGKNWDQGWGITIDNFGHVYVTGTFIDTADFDPGPGVFQMVAPNSSSDPFILKLDTGGNFIWAKQFTGTNGDVGYSIATDTVGNVFVGGAFRDTVDFDPGAGVFTLGTNFFDDAYIAKLDSNGNFIWAKQFAGNSNQTCYDIATDLSGSVIATGSFQSTTDFDPNAGTFNLTAGVVDVFVLKLDANGNLVWANDIGSGATTNLGRSVVVDSSGNSYSTGYFDGSQDFDPGAGTAFLTAQGSDDAFVRKLDATGSLVWVKKFGGNGFDEGYGIYRDRHGSIYLTGNFNGGPVDFDPGAGAFLMTATGTNDAYINKLDSLGAFQWAVQMGGTGAVDDDRGRGIVVNGIGNVYTTGYFRNTVDFDPTAGTFNIASNGIEDGFLQKLCQPSTGSMNAVACDSFTVPSGDETHYTSGIYPDTLMNSGGCDSIIQINVTINNSTSYTLFDTACNSYTVPSGDTTYTTSGTYVDLISNAIGCDSLITINLVVNHESSDTVVAVICDSVYTSPDGLETWAFTGIYHDTIPNAAGCDSNITVDLTVNFSSWATDTVETCDSNYTSPSGNYVWDSAGVYLDTISNSVGCDSFMTIQLMFITQTFDSISPSVCDANYTSPSGKVFTISGMYQDTVINSSGCDSIISINLTINNSTSDTISPVDCDSSYLSPSGKYTWTTSGTYLDTVNNAVGCDSFITVDLTVVNIDTSISPGQGLLFANETSATYQWLDCDSMTVISGETAQTFTPAVDGNYAVILTQNACVDTSECHSVIVIGVQDILENDLNVFPNPTSGQVKWRTNGGLHVMAISLSDISGRALISKLFRSPRNHGEFSIHELPRGIYFLRFESEDGSSRMEKIIKR